jgi:hypothetical protein
MEGFFFDLPVQAIVIMSLIIFSSFFIYGYISHLIIIKKYNLKILY